LQGQEVTIAQAGPALVWIGHPKTVDQYPATPAPQGVALGGVERPDPKIYHARVEPGSMILLAQSDWLKRVPPEAMAAVTTAESVAQASDFLGQLAGEAELSALLIGVTSALPEVVEEGPALRPVSGLESAPRPSPPVPAPWQKEGAGPTPAVAEPAARGLAAGVGPTKPRAWLAERIRGVGQRLLAAGKGPAAPAELAPAPPRPQRTPALAEAVTPAGLGEKEVEETARRSLWPLVLAVVVIPLLIAALVLSMWWLRSRATEARFRELLSGASTAIAEAEALPDEATARLRLTDAKDFLEQARAIRPTDAGLAELQKKYDVNLDRINHVTPLYGVIPLWDFKDAGLRLGRVVVGGRALFVLDRGRQEVSHFALSDLGDSVTPGTPPIAIRKGQQVDDLVVSDIVDVAWMTAVGNQHSKLLALDTSGGLVGYDTTYGAIRLPIEGRDQWSYPQLIASYNGNLYIVDTKANQIWRYRPGEKGYETAPERYFAPDTEVDLAGVEAIAIDGSIWLLYADGRLLKFFVGEQQAFDLSGLPDPLAAPTALAVSQDGDQIYIADAGNGRIVEFSKSGEFQRQFRPAQGDVLKEVHDIYLDEAAAAFFILSGDKLYKVDLPKPALTPVPPAPTPTPSQ
jgi:sugar lactone lactonase YvrE